MKKFRVKAEKVEVVEDLTIDSSDEQSGEAVVEETEAVVAEHAEEETEAEETEAEETEAEETEAEETEAVVAEQSQAPGLKTSKPNQNKRGRR
jgi:hypothetical protein